MTASSDKKLFLLAGEQSGDLLGSLFLEQWSQSHPDSLPFGVGGPLMRAQGLDTFLPMERFQAMGMSQLFFSIPRLVRQFYAVRRQILASQPPLTLLIDYPGFNLRLAQSLRRQGYRGKIVQLVCPMVWAWGRQRVEQMAANLDLLLPILPFEAQYFSKTTLKVHYIGHPLATAVAHHRYEERWRDQVPLAKGARLLALFPGSRGHVISLNLPDQIQTALALCRVRPDTRVAISCSHSDYLPLIQRLVDKTAGDLSHRFALVPHTFTYELMRDCHAAIASSGTVTLELALHRKPAIVVYRLSLLDRIAARCLFHLHLPYYCLVNILGGTEVFPELIERGFALSDAMKRLLPLYDDTPERKNCLVHCDAIATRLYDGSNPMKRAVEAITLILR